jgi:hypothetical protein
MRGMGGRPRAQASKRAVWARAGSRRVGPGMWVGGGCRGGRRSGEGVEGAEGAGQCSAASDWALPAAGPAPPGLTALSRQRGPPQGGGRPKSGRVGAAAHWGDAWGGGRMLDKGPQGEVSGAVSERRRSGVEGRGSACRAPPRTTGARARAAAGWKGSRRRGERRQPQAVGLWAARGHATGDHRGEGFNTHARAGRALPTTERGASRAARRERAWPALTQRGRPAQARGGPRGLPARAAPPGARACGAPGRRATRSARRARAAARRGPRRAARPASRRAA